MSSLIDDIEEGYHQHLLESGNLIAKRQAWAGQDVWESRGYVAKLNRIHCECGAKHKMFVGIFHREYNPARKATKEVVMHCKAQIPQNQNWPTEVTHIPAGICPSCYSSKGFAKD